MIIGVHTSMAKGLAVIPPFLHQLGCNAMQLFLHSPRQWRESKYNQDDIDGFKKGVAQFGIKAVLGHSSYFTNFAMPWQNAERAMHFLKFDLAILQRIGGYGLVTHVGKCLTYNKKEGCAFIASNLNRLLTESAEFQIPLFLENGAGQGTEFGVTFDELAEIYEGISAENRKRLFFCLDTCHSFAAGYDYRTQEAVKKTFAEFDRLLGKQNLKAIHLNDSKKPFGSHVDRHANIGEGEIGLNGINLIVAEAVKRQVPIILETPDLYNDVLYFTHK